MTRYLFMEILTLGLSKSKIVGVGRNVIVDMDFSEMFKYQVEIWNRYTIQLDTDDGTERFNEETDPKYSKESNREAEYQLTAICGYLIHKTKKIRPSLLHQPWIW